MTAVRDYIRQHGESGPAVVDEIVRRVVNVAKPDRIVLFGFAARGEMGPNSDLDFLVIKSGEYDRARIEGDIYVAMHGVGIAANFILVTPQQVEWYKQTKHLFFRTALNEGMDVRVSG